MRCSQEDLAAPSNAILQLVGPTEILRAPLSERAKPDQDAGHPPGPAARRNFLRRVIHAGFLGMLSLIVIYQFRGHSDAEFLCSFRCGG